VTVADIAERAEVGRTTFFRYFGDKQEVVFSEEQALMDDWVGRHRALPPVRSPDDVLAQTREFTLLLCREMTADPEHFLQHERLLDANPELNDRAMRKYQRLVDAMSENLRRKGTPEPTATLVPHLALACFRTARRVAGLDPVALPAAVDAAFDHLAGFSPTR
jgi:AcrR family transcriptional regulator